MTPFNPDSVGDYITLITLALIAMCSAVLPVAIPVWSKLKSIDGQVSNTHDTNLRDDLDKLGVSINTGFTETRREFQLLHEGLNIERRERIAGDQLRREAA